MRRFDEVYQVDLRTSTRKSLVLRYRKSGIVEMDDTILRATSMQEGDRIVRLMNYRGVGIYIFDETTLSTTNTFEALVAMIAVSHARALGHTTALFSSGGNLGVALAAYCKKAGLRAISFNPLSSMPYLDSRWFRKDVHLVAVRDAQKTRDMMLKLRMRLRRKLGYDPLIPTIPWRLEAARFRGLAIAEYMLDHDLRFAALSQTVSAGFGPLGTFDMLRDVKHRRFISKLPRFLGVQQEANAYMYGRWKRKRVTSTSSLIVPTLFDKNPHKTFGTFPALARLLKETRGDMVTVNDREFDRYITPSILSALRKKGVRHTVSRGEIIGRSGLMGLAGMMKAIDSGLVAGDAVLVCMTDGSQKVAIPAQPEIIVESESDLSAVEKIMKV